MRHIASCFPFPSVSGPPPFSYLCSVSRSAPASSSSSFHSSFGSPPSIIWNSCFVSFWIDLFQVSPSAPRRHLRPEQRRFLQLFSLIFEGDIIQFIICSYRSIPVSFWLCRLSLSVRALRIFSILGLFFALPIIFLGVFSVSGHFLIIFHFSSAPNIPSSSIFPKF